LDLSRLKEEAKVLVIYKVISEVYDLMQANRLPLDRLLIDLDELNQHAPRRQTGAASRLLTNRIQDLAERSRTDGIILLTAQQTLSDVDDRVEANIATRFYGMMGLQEAQQSIYGFTELEKYLVTRLEPSEMLVQHPMLKHRVKVRVPRAMFLRGKAGQALLQPMTEVSLAERLQRLLSGLLGRAIPTTPQIQAVIQICLAKGISEGDLENVARQVGEIAPLEAQRNTGKATLKLWLIKIKAVLGIEVELE
jgi:DNA helicase HerA-like ATPase